MSDGVDASVMAKFVVVENKYDQQLADEAEQQYLHECALRDIAQGIPGWDYIEEDTKL
jgi:hypothetical protein